MPLPTVEFSEHETTVAGVEGPVRFRPFLVREEKILLLALESSDQEHVVRAVRQIFDACVLTDGVRSDTVPFFAFEELYLRIREVSVSDVVDLHVTHGEDDECEHRTLVRLRLPEVKLDGEPPNPLVPIDDRFGVQFRYPTVDEVSASDSGAVGGFDLMASCMVQVYELTGDEHWPVTDRDEARQWLESLNRSQFSKIVEWFTGLPRLAHEISYTCESCGHDETVKLRGLSDFFE